MDIAAIEAERDKVRADYRESVRSTAEEFKRLRSEMEWLERNLESAKASHDMQRRNTEAFMKERDAARAALGKALLWTDEEHDVGEWREEAQAAIKP